MGEPLENGQHMAAFQTPSGPVAAHRQGVLRVFYALGQSIPAMRQEPYRLGPGFTACRL